MDRYILLYSFGHDTHPHLVECIVKKRVGKINLLVYKRCPFCTALQWYDDDDDDINDDDKNDNTFIVVVIKRHII